MSPYVVVVEGVRNGILGTFHYVVEGISEDAAIVNASNLQSVRMLDEVHEVRLA